MNHSSSWRKFTDSLPRGKSYFSKINLYSSNLDKGILSSAHRPFIPVSIKIPSRSFIFTPHRIVCVRFANENDRRWSTGPSLNLEFCMKIVLIWKKNKREIQIGLEFTSNREKPKWLSWFRLHYWKRPVDV